MSKKIFAVILYFTERFYSAFFNTLGMTKFKRINNALIINPETGSLHVSILNTGEYKKYSYIKERDKIREKLLNEVYQGIQSSLKNFRDGKLKVQEIWGISHKTIVNSRLEDIFNKVMNKNDFEIIFTPEGKKSFEFECVHLIKIKELMAESILNRIFRERDTVMVEIRRKSHEVLH